MVRKMTAADITAGMRLKALAGWNQTQVDWRLLLAAHPEGCFVAERDGRVVGTVTTINYENAIGWIGMMLVDPEYRRTGIGTELMTAALRSLTQCPTVKLDATAEGRQLYRGFDFADEYTISRMTIRSLPALPVPSAHVQPMTAAGMTPAAELDKTAFGADRAALLHELWQSDPQRGWQSLLSGRVRAFCLGRAGTEFHQIGPVTAETPADATAVTAAALAKLAGRAVVLDVPQAAVDFRTWLAGLGFEPQRPFVRMYRGRRQNAATVEKHFAIAGPEFG